jgi:hypothetical protein
MYSQQYGSDPNAAFYAPPTSAFQQPAGMEDPAASSEAWFSDANMQTNSGYPQVGGIAPVAPIGSATSRPLTSLGFELPSADPLAGGLGGSLTTGKNGYGPHVSRFGISAYEGEPPLLVELGIDFSIIAEKTKSALHPSKPLDPSLMSDGDIAGPFVFCFALGFLLMLAGKLHFGYVFGFGVVGCIAIYTVLNLLTQKENGIDLHVVFSVLGYSLLPVVFLAGVAVIIPLKGVVGWVLVPPCIGWCTFTATRFFEAVLAAREQRYLIAYPAFLFFACFALITVF